MKLPAKIFLTFLAALTFQVAAEDEIAETREGTLIDRIVAIVNDDVVLESELDSEVTEFRKLILDRGAQLPSEETFRRQVLERMITNKLQMQLAERAGIQLSDDRLNQALAGIAERAGVSFTDFPAELAKQGIEYTTYREDMRREFIMEELRRSQVAQRVVVTPTEVDQLLNARLDGNEPDYLISHILVVVPSIATPDEAELLRERAQRIHDLLTDGNDFSETAIAYSDGQNALEGGSLGWLKKSELPSIFSDVIDNLGEGEISNPIRSSSGYHIISINEIRRENAVVVMQTHIRHILITPNAILIPDKAQALALELRQRILDGEDFEDLAAEYSDDPGTSTRGGDLDWNAPGTFVPEFEDAMNELAIGELGQPVQTQFGFHLMEVLGRRQEDMTDQSLRNEAYSAIHSRKLREQTLVWLQQLRDEAYLDVRIGG
ncbi:MAG: peptidylprolyl isomerase [Gammaproteobacteria bacterium]